MSNRRDFLRKTALAGVITTLTPAWISAEPVSPSKKRRSLRIAHITDVHILNKPNANTYFSRVLRQINSMVDKPDLIINTGDTVMDENRQTREIVESHWLVWNQIVRSENEIPIKSALGNHDVWYGPDSATDEEYRKDQRYGKQWAINELKLPHRYYSYEKKGWHFIALDSINGTEGYQLDDEQFEWLARELDQINRSTPICIYNHVPILSMGALLYYTKRKPIAEVKFPSGDMHNDHQRLKDLFFKHKNVRLCLSGHVHYVDAIEYLGIKYLCNGAVSGNWWGTPLVLDEFPPVYSIIDLYPDGSSDHQYIYYNLSLT
jgi:3',5'-cyclic AMP phosphodiesterase CpdA